MITANYCRLNSMALVCEYCEKHIEPLLLKKSGPVYYGKYNSEGTMSYYIGKTYAADAPTLKSLGAPDIRPQEIKSFLEMLGYKVDWVPVDESYPAGYSSTRRTKYYNAGYNSYWSLKISY
jgi:hypothetical protein